MDRVTSVAKKRIQEEAETRLSARFNVICARGDFSYITNTEKFCQETVGDVTCYVFKQLSDVVRARLHWFCPFRFDQWVLRAAPRFGSIMYSHKSAEDAIRNIRRGTVAAERDADRACCLPRTNWKMPSSAHIRHSFTTITVLLKTELVEYVVGTAASSYKIQVLIFTSFEHNRETSWDFKLLLHRKIAEPIFQNSMITKRENSKNFTIYVQKLYNTSDDEVWWKEDARLLIWTVCMNIH